MQKGGIVSDVFETLGGTVKGTAKQAASDAKKMGEDAAVELGLKTAANNLAQDDQSAAPAHTKEQYQKIDKAAKQRAASKYKQIQEEIRQLQKKREQEEQAYRSGPTGQKAETTLVKQLEVSHQPKAKLDNQKPAVNQKELPPLPAKKASRKTEMFRGASG